MDQVPQFQGTSVQNKSGKEARELENNIPLAIKVEKFHLAFRMNYIIHKLFT